MISFFENCISFVYPWRKSEPKRNRVHELIVKLLEDKMTFLRFWGDYGQIAELKVRKFWGETTGIGISVCQIRNPFSPVRIVSTQEAGAEQGKKNRKGLRNSKQG